MRLCLTTLTGLVLLAGCTSTPDESKVGTLDFYDWIDLRRIEYAHALDGGRTDEQAMKAHQMKVQIDRRFDSIVQRAATEQDPWRRELAVSALGFSQRPEAVAHIEPHLADPLPSVRGTAAAAIGFLRPSNPPMEKIEALLNDSDTYARQAALFAIKNLGGPGRKPSDAALARIKELAKSDPSFGVRNEAVLALGRILDESSMDMLARECLVDESALVRSNAATVLAGFKGKARLAVPFLIDRLKDGESGVVQRAHFALKAITGVDLDPQYGSWVDWFKEISKVLEYYCEKDNKVSTSAGPCPVCGVLMEARAVPGVEFACPEHPEVTSQKAQKCFKCGRDLLPQKKDGMKDKDGVK
jgi:hypothetical protein